MLLWPGLISLPWGSFSCGLQRCHSYLSINHGPLSPAMPSTGGDSIDSEWCCCRLSNYTQHGKGSSKAWLWYGSQPYRRFCCFIFETNRRLVWFQKKSLLIEPVYGFNLLFTRRDSGVVTCVATFLCCGAGIRIQHMTAVSGLLFFEVISRQIF